MKIKIGPYRKNRAYHIHIDDWDVWSLDYTLATIIHPALIRLKKINHGYPELWEEGMVKHHNWTRQLHFDFIDEEVESKYLLNKWELIMDKMIYAFEMIKKDNAVYWTNEEAEKVDEGLKLFGKHYQNLWD